MYHFTVGEDVIVKIWDQSYIGKVFQVLNPDQPHLGMKVHFGPDMSKVPQDLLSIVFLDRNGPNDQAVYCVAVYAHFVEPLNFNDGVDNWI